MARPIIAADRSPSPTPGNIADVSMATPPRGAVAPARRLIADEADDADRRRRWPNARRIEAVIPSTATQTVAYPLDRTACRRHNPNECLFGRLENRRRPATRGARPRAGKAGPGDRLARNYLAALALVAVVGEWA